LCSHQPHVRSSAPNNATNCSCDYRLLPSSQVHNAATQPRLLCDNHNTTPLPGRLHSSTTLTFFKDARFGITRPVAARAARSRVACSSPSYRLNTPGFRLESVSEGPFNYVVSRVSQSRRHVASRRDAAVNTRWSQPVRKIVVGQPSAPVHTAGCAPAVSCTPAHRTYQHVMYTCTTDACAPKPKGRCITHTAPLAVHSPRSSRWRLTYLVGGSLRSLMVVVVAPPEHNGGLAS
jgi:hypothetical protein